MNTKIDNLARQNLLAVADQLIVSGANFLLVLLCAQSLPPGEQGKVGYIIAANFAVVMISVTSLFQLATVESVHQADPRQYRNSLAAFQAALAAVSSIATGLVVALAASAADWNATGTEVLLLITFLFCQQLADFDRRSSYIFAEPGRALVSSAALYAIRFGLLLAFPFADVNDVLVILIVSCVAPALISTSRAAAGLQGSTRVAAFIRDQVRLSSWLIASGPLSWLWGNLLIFLTGALVGLSAVAVIVTLRSVTNIANVGLEFLETQGAVVLARLEKADNRAYMASFRSLLSISILVWIGGLLLVVLLGERIIGALYGSFYQPHWYLMVWLWAVNLAILVFKLASIRLRIQRHTREIFQSYAVGVIAALVFISSGAVAYGLPGAVAGFALSALALSTSVLIYQRRRAI